MSINISEHMSQSNIFVVYDGETNTVKVILRGAIARRDRIISLSKIAHTHYIIIDEIIRGDSNTLSSNDRVEDDATHFHIVDIVRNPRYYSNHTIIFLNV